MSRVLLANVWQESNSFVPTRTDLDGFRRYYLLFGTEVVEELRGGDVEVSGIIAAAEEDGMEVLPLVAAMGFSGGPVTGEAYVFLQDQVLEGARRHAAEVDGAVLAMHGAMLTDDLDDPEGDLVVALRRILGPDKPIVCSLDMHAYIAPQMVEQATALVGYHTHPHVDFYETGYRAMKLLGQVLREEVRPVMVQRKLRMIAQGEKHNTSHGPMSEVMGRVLEMEQEPGVLSVSVFPEHESLDVPDLGFSIVAISDGDVALAQDRVNEVAGLTWENRRRFLAQKTSVAEALRLAQETAGGPVVLADASDATSGGSPGDSTWVLGGLLESPVEGVCLLTITDPEAVEECVAAGVGAEVTVEVGGMLAPAFSEPVGVTGRVRTISDGVFRMKLPAVPADIGRTVVLQVRDIYLVISEWAAITFDEEVYRRVGLFPREAKVVVVKSHGGFRPVYGPFAKAVVELDTPGPCNTDVSQLPFRRMTRPVFPLDDVDDADRFYIVNSREVARGLLE